MIKKLFLLSLVASQLMISCSSDEETPEEVKTPEVIKEQTLAEQIAEIVKQPYSKLSPADQKTKLEVEANEMFVQLDKTKSSGAIEAIENLSRLLSLYHIDLFDGRNRNGVEEALSVSGIYGIYTWNDAEKIWIKTASQTELKFVFPAKKSQTKNTAALTSKSTSSDVKMLNIDTYAEWAWNPKTEHYEQTSPDIEDWFYLPTSVDAVLTIDGVSAATFAQTAKYSNGKQVPNEFAYKMTLNDGYTWEMSSTKKAAENTAKASLTYNGKTLLDFNAGSNADIDALIDNDELIQYRGKANGLIKLMDNFVIVADMDLVADAADKEALYKSLVAPKEFEDYNDPKNDYKAYYTAKNALELKRSQGLAANFNKNIKLILVSKKDGTKIADLVKHSEKAGDDYIRFLPVWNAEFKYWEWGESGESIAQPYLEEVLYLKFNDNTEVAFSAYFSSGFENLETKFNDFISSFKK